MASVKNPFVLPPRKEEDRYWPVRWALVCGVIAILGVAVLVGGCSHSYVDYASQMRDANGNPIYPTLSQPELNSPQEE